MTNLTDHDAIAWTLISGLTNDEMAGAIESALEMVDHDHAFAIELVGALISGGHSLFKLLMAEAGVADEGNFVDGTRQLMLSRINGWGAS